MLKFLLTGVFLALLTGMYYAPMPNISDEMIAPPVIDLYQLDQNEDPGSIKKMVATLEKGK